MVKNGHFYVLGQVFGNKYFYDLGSGADILSSLVSHLVGICVLVDLITILRGVGTENPSFDQKTTVKNGQHTCHGREKAISEIAKPRLRSRGLRFSSRG